MSQWSFEDTHSPQSEHEGLPFSWETRNKDRQQIMDQFKVVPQLTEIFASGSVENGSPMENRNGS